MPLPVKEEVKEEEEEDAEKEDPTLPSSPSSFDSEATTTSTKSHPAALEAAVVAIVVEAVVGAVGVAEKDTPQQRASSTLLTIVLGRRQAYLYPRSRRTRVSSLLSMMMPNTGIRLL